jgi:hypothetical protein
MTIIETNQAELANKVFVNSLQDLPTPTGNIIQLEDNFTYEFANGTIDLEGNRIVLGLSNVLIGQGIFQTFLTSTGLPTGETFISVIGDPNVNIYTFQSFTIQSLPTDTITFDIDGAGLLILTTMSVQNSGAVGNIANVNGFRANNLCQFGGNQSGFVFSGNFYALIFHMVSFQNDAVGTSYITIAAGTTIGFALTFGACYFIGDGSQTAINIDPTVTFLFTQNAPFTVLGCSFLFMANAISGYTGTELQCKFRVNVGLQDTNLFGGYYFGVNLDQTGIPAVSTFVKAEGNTTASDLRGFSMTDKNQLTYQNLQAGRFKVSVSGFISPLGNETPTLSLAIAKNGTVIDSSVMNVTSAFLNALMSVGSGSAISTSVIVDLVENDYIEIWIANQTSGTKIILDTANLTIIEV